VEVFCARNVASNNRSRPMHGTEPQRHGGYKKVGVGQEVAIFRWKLPTEEKMAAQNFTFAPKTGFSAPNFVYS